MRGSTLVLLLGALLGCSADDDATRTCVEGGKTYRAGESWLCSDKCNHCSCYSDGTYTMTGKSCDAGADGG